MKMLFVKCNFSDPNRCAQITFCSINPFSPTHYQREMNDYEMIQVRQCFLIMQPLFSALFLVSVDFFFLTFFFFFLQAGCPK